MNKEQLRDGAKTVGSKVLEGLAALGLSSGFVAPAEAFVLTEQDDRQDDRSVEEPVEEL